MLSTESDTGNASSSVLREFFSSIIFAPMSPHNEFRVESDTFCTGIGSAETLTLFISEPLLRRFGFVLRFFDFDFCLPDIISELSIVKDCIFDVAFFFFVFKTFTILTAVSGM